MAAVAIAVSFFVIIVAVAVSSGFRYAVRDGVAAMCGDIRIQPYAPGGHDAPPMSATFPSRVLFESMPEVESMTPAVVRAGVVKSGDLVQGVVVKGVPAASGAPSEPLGVSIPHRLAEVTGVGVGDQMVTYFIGEKVRVRKFLVTALHRDIVETDDNLLVYARLEDMQRLNGWSEEEVSCLDVLLKPMARGREHVENLSGEMSFLMMESGVPEEENLHAVASTRTFPQVFDWLELLDFNVLIVLILMTVVAGFNMVSGLLIMLLRNISTIGTLKTLGMTNAQVGRLFLRIGAGGAFKGMLMGNAAALLFCFIQGTWHVIPLDPANYFVSWVPVHIDVLWILMADAAAFLGILALLWLPTLLVARIDPAATVKAE